jgi:hypothetical protein
MPIWTPAAYKLGKQPPPDDLRKKTVNLDKYMDLSQLPAYPANHKWSAKVTKPWGMLLNDNEGDCTCACAGHMILCWDQNVGKGYPVVSDADVQTAYVAVTGWEGAAYNPATGANDNGCAILDVLDYWHKIGIGGHKILMNGTISPYNLAAIKAGIYFFGGADIGINLPLAWQNASIWDVGPGGSTSGSWTPGSWGGHSVPLVDYSPTDNTCVTWGQLMKITDSAIAAYCDEVHCVISSQDWLNQLKRTPSGLNLAAMERDFGKLSSVV